MALETPVTFKGLPCQNTGAHVPAGQRPHLSPPLCSPHSWQIWLAGLLGVTLILDPLWNGPSQEAWHHNTREWRPLSHSPGLTLAPRYHRGC